jgi:hypothetical protein
MSKTSQWLQKWPALAPVGALLCGALGSWVVGSVLASASTLAPHLSSLKHGTVCASGAVAAIDGLRLYSADANWAAAFALELVVDAIALALAISTAVAVGKATNFRWQWWAVLVLGLGIVALDVREVNKLLRPSNVGANMPFLSMLLSTVECPGIRQAVRNARLVGESTGFCVGAVMCSVLAFAEAPTADGLRQRLEHLRRLLYVASLLFVMGIIVSRANFTLVLAHWDQGKSEVAKALGEVVRVGTVQAGAGYSALLMIFFVPVRAVLGRRIAELARSKNKIGPAEKEGWLAEHGLEGSWQEDARQILALLAPVLAAPVFDVIAKAKGA